MQLVEKHVRRSERGVPAKVNLAARREPAQIETLPIANKKSRFGQIILGGNGLERGIRKPCLQRANSGWIATKNAFGKSVNLVDGKLHLESLP
jgi:hypothetical protein